MRVYHGGRDGAHRARDRALAAAGAEVRLVVPAAWPNGDAITGRDEPFSIVELEVLRAGDVNRHRHRSRAGVARVLAEAEPDVLDLHEEPFSAVVHQWLRAAPAAVPMVLYTAQNLDKRLPFPFARYEREALMRAAGLYPCTAQAASVARGKGFAGTVEVLPLGFDDAVFRAGAQSADDDELVFAFVGRLVPEKGVLDAVRVLARLSRVRRARLVVAGSGPEEGPVRQLAESLGVGDRVELAGRRSGEALAGVYRAAHVVLVPSRPTSTWTEQFGRVIVEGQASGALVAGYDSGAVAEVAGGSAVLAPVGRADALADRIAEAVGDDAVYQLRRREGLALAATRTWDRVAERQLDLYRAALAEPVRVALPRSPSGRRVAARAEFGPPAAGGRPFALPVLRRGGPIAAVLASASDAVAEARARLAQRQSSS